MSTEELIKQTAGELKNLISGQCIIGEPIEIGDKVLFTVSRFGLGFGAGSGKGGGCKGGAEGEGSGAGAGGAIEPIAVIVLHKDISGKEGVEILPIRKDNPISQIITSLGEALLPPVIELIKKDKGKESEEKPKSED